MYEDKREGEWELNQLLFPNDTALIAGSVAKLQNLVMEFGRVCERRISKWVIGV